MSALLIRIRKRITVGFPENWANLLTLSQCGILMRKISNELEKKTCC